MKTLFLIAALLVQTVGQLPPQTGIVTGRLTRNGQPAVGVRVSAMVIPEPGVAVTDAVSLASVVQTDSEGRYRLENIPPGSYYVTAGFLDLPTYYPGVASIVGANAVRVEAGATTAGIDFTTAVSTGATLSGRVIFPPGGVIPYNHNVTLAGPQRPAPTGVLKSDGSFEIPRVKPGTYTLRAASVMATLVVGEADVSDVELEVPYNVSGAIIVEGGGPIPNLSVSFTSLKPGAAAQTVPVSPAGVFVTPLTQGEYRINVSGLPSGYSLKSITSGPFDLIANPLTLGRVAGPAAITATLSVSSPPPWVKVTGRVRGPGVVPPGTLYPVALSGKGLLAPITSRLAADGSFELPSVLPGEYTLEIGEKVRRSIPVKVANADLDGLEIVMPATKEVTARVTMDAASQGSTGFTLGGSPNVVVYMRNGAQPSFDLVLSDASGTTTTAAARQADGTYRVKLPEGERIVTATVAGNTVKALSYGTSNLLQGAPLRVSASDSSQLEMTLSLSASDAAMTSLGALSASLRGMVTEIRIINTNATNGLSFISSVSQPGPAAPTTVHVGPDVARASLISSDPPANLAAAIREPVILRVEIDKDGNVTNVSVIRGDPLPNDAAIAAVKQRRYRPQLLNGQPTAFVTTVTLP